jgi:GT2 family glycosyltransferase
MQSIPLVSVLIVYWNNAEYLPRCLDCLSAQTFRDFETIVIDNGSVDGGTEGLEQKYSGVDLHLERLTSNLGFAAANNIGTRLARGKWLALLNADAFPEPDWLANLVAATEANPRFTSFSSRQLQANNPELLDGAGDAYHVSGLAWRRYFGYSAKDYGLEQLEVFSPCAAAAMYLREAFLDAGGFDEDFFSYFEDVDLGFRLQLMGYRSIYVPDAIVSHIGAVTFGKRSDFSLYHSQRNLIWTFIKNMPHPMLLRYLPAHFIANLIQFAYYALHGRGRVLWRAKIEAMRNLSKVLKKRGEIQSRRKANLSDLKKVMQCGLLEPYLLSKNLQKFRRHAN